jgi:hypothetical protein
VDLSDASLFRATARVRVRISVTRWRGRADDSRTERLGGGAIGAGISRCVDVGFFSVAQADSH